MDVVKFLEEAKRMCDSYSCCEACPANADGFNDCLIDNMHNIDVADAVSIVEKWSMEHPRKTRQSVFLEQYPEAVIDEHGVLQVCPMYVSAAHRNSDGECGDPYEICTDCRRKFWMQEVEQWKGL